MSILALFILVSVAIFGGYIVVRRQQRKPTYRWMVLGHAFGAITGLLLLLVGSYELYTTEALNDFSLIALLLIAGVVAGGFFLFEKVLKGKRKPVFLLWGHGLFATLSIGVLAYSFII